MKNKIQKGINDFQFYIATNKQASEYETVAKSIINYIKRISYRDNNIAKTLQTLTIQDSKKRMPILKMSNVTDQSIVTKESKQNTKPCLTKLLKELTNIIKHV